MSAKYDTFTAFVEKNSTLDDSDNSSDDGLADIEDLIKLPDPSSVRLSRQSRFYQHNLPIENGLYEGLIDEKLRRNGLGIYSVNNGQDYYCGQWLEDKANGIGFQKLNYNASIVHGTFRNGVLSEGYGRRTLDANFEYDGKLMNDKFHGLGSLSTLIDGVNRNEPIVLVANWACGKVATVYRNEIEEIFLAQCDIFNSCLKAIAHLSDLGKQRDYFGVLIELLEKPQLSSMLLKDINKCLQLPRELKSSADFLLRMDTAYENMGSFFEATKRPNKKPDYTECVRKACLAGLERYMRFLQSRVYEEEAESRFLDLDRVIGTSLRDLLDSTTTNYNTLAYLQKILYIDPSVLDLIKKLTRTVNEMLYETPQSYHQKILDTETQLITSIWSDYLEMVNRTGLCNAKKKETNSFIPQINCLLPSNNGCFVPQIK